MTGIPDIQKKYSPEMALAILICRVYLDEAQPTELHDYIAACSINWKLFEQIISSHQVRPLIYKILSAHNKNVDPAFMARLRQKCFRIAAGNLQKLEELVRLNKLFANNGIPNFPYKGVILSRYLYGDYVSRETFDIDFLIDAVDFSKVYKILSADGYMPRYYNPDFELQFLHTSHELMFTKTSDSGTIKIEIHWAATNNMMNIPLPNKDLFLNPDTIKLQERDVAVFNLENQLLVLLVHHGVNDIWRALRHNLDISLFLKKYSSQIDWASFHNLTLKYRIRHTTQTGFLISSQLFGTHLPEIYQSSTPLPEFILENLLCFPPVKKRKLNTENLRQQLFLRDSFIDKIRLLLSYIHTGVTPNVRDMEAYPISKKWYVLYYLIKPYRILFGKHK